MPKTLEAVWHDNRGDETAMYGFVYFNDERRVVYTSFTGVTNSTGGWGPVTTKHVRLAEEYLNEKAPGWNTTPAE